MMMVSLVLTVELGVAVAEHVVGVCAVFAGLPPVRLEGYLEVQPFDFSITVTRQGPRQPENRLNQALVGRSALHHCRFGDACGPGVQT
jgi:hypothetical protein